LKLSCAEFKKGIILVDKSLIPTTLNSNDRESPLNFSPKGEKFACAHFSPKGEKFACAHFSFMLRSMRLSCRIGEKIQLREQPKKF
jgi:hypothetical protein